MTITPHHTTTQFTISGWTKIYPSIGRSGVVRCAVWFVPYGFSGCPYGKPFSSKVHFAASSVLNGYQFSTRREQKPVQFSRLLFRWSSCVSVTSVIRRRTLRAERLALLESEWRGIGPGKHALGRVGVWVPPVLVSRPKTDGTHPHSAPHQNLTGRFPSLANKPPRADSELAAGAFGVFFRPMLWRERNAKANKQSLPHGVGFWRTKRVRPCG